KYIEGPLLNLGMTLTDLGDYPGAIDAFTRVIAKQPTWVFAFNELGIAYRKQNRFIEAAEQFRKAVAMDAKFVSAWFNLAETQFRAGNLPEAQKAYQQVKRLRPAMAPTLELLSGGRLRD
ncbi:MAG: tetratricopeptide repeat protein, partial [Acidobacteria bacterium]|nr:tetratricopeptide repeat protein [Acidobacteriota bacterium]